MKKLKAFSCSPLAFKSATKPSMAGKIIRVHENLSGESHFPRQIIAIIFGFIEVD